MARLKTIPEDIKSAIFSIQTPEIIKGAIKQNNIPEEKISRIADIIGLVFLGFIHPEDLAREIETQAGIPAKTAANLADALNKKLFTAIRQDLDKAYAPVPHEEGATAPKILQEIKPPTPGSASSRSTPVGTAINPMMIAENFKVMPVTPVAMPKPPMPAPAPAAPAWKPQQVTSQTAAGMNVSTTPLASNRNTPGQAPMPPQPAKPPADKGWSRKSPQDPVVKLGVITPNVLTPVSGNIQPSTNAQARPMQAPATPASAPVSQAQKNSGGGSGSGEFARLDMMRKAPAMPGAAAPIPPPVMLHQVSPSSVQQSPEFRVNMGIQNQINKVSAPPPMPNRPAVIEFGGGNGGGSMKAPLPSPAPSSAQRTINYNDPKMSGPRNITEITSAPTAQPMPPSQPQPAPQPTRPIQPAPAPLPPKPPVPPQVQSQQQPVMPPPNTKTIVKDFL